MAHVLINAVSAKSGGAATYIMNLATRLATVHPQHRFTIYIPQTLVEHMPILQGNILVIGTEIGSASWWRRVLWDQITLRRILTRTQIDVLVSSSDFGMFSPPCGQLLMIRNGLFFSAIYAGHVLIRHGWKTRLTFRLRQIMVLASVRCSDAVMVASRSMCKDVVRITGCRSERITVNPFGVPLDRFADTVCQPIPPNQIRNNPFRLLYISEYGDYKNLSTLYRAVKHLATLGQKDILLVTTADPWQNPNVESVSRAQDQILCQDPLVAPFIKNVGYVPYREVPSLYRDCDAFLFPSLVESFGHPLVEAMASGRPIIAADTPVNREICGEAALYFEPMDSSGVAAHILRLQRDNELGVRMSAAGRKRAEQHFDWRDHVGRFLKCIDEVASGA